MTPTATDTDARRYVNVPIMGREAALRVPPDIYDRTL